MRKRKLVTAKEVAKVLKVSPEVISYLRQYEGLPYTKNSKYILFSEPEVIRWRNRKLANEAKVVLNLRDYYNKIGLGKFIGYDEFHAKVEEIAFLDGDNLLQYVRRQNPEKDVQDLVGDIVFRFWDARKPKCKICGRNLTSTLYRGLCKRCHDQQKLNAAELPRDN
jgi:tRNA(Ile2) C34 agmatinyltransferase TiaS